MSWRQPLKLTWIAWQHWQQHMKEVSLLGTSSTESTVVFIYTMIFIYSWQPKKGIQLLTVLGRKLLEHELHNGSHALHIAVVIARVACWNGHYTADYVIKASGMVIVWTFKTTSNTRYDYSAMTTAMCKAWLPLCSSCSRSFLPKTISNWMH